MPSDVKMVLDADTKAYNRKLKEANDKARKIAKTHKKSSKELAKQTPLMGKINNAMSTMTSTAGLVSAAVLGIAAAWNHVADARKAAGEKILTELDASKALAQVATSSKDKLQLDEESRMFSATSGIDLGRAKRIRFGLRSAGDDASLGLFSEASKIEGDIEGLIGGVHTVKGAFGGGSRGTLNQLLAASKQSKFSITELAQGSATAGRDVAATGTSPEEFLALLGSEFGTKSAEVTATGLKGLSGALAQDKKLMGLRSESGSLIETVKNIQAYMIKRGIEEKDLAKIIKSQEARSGFFTVSKAIAKGTIEDDIKGIKNSQGLLEQTTSFLTAGDTAGIRNRRAQASFDAAGVPEGIEALDIQSQSLTENAASRNSNFINRYATSLQGRFRELTSYNSGVTAEQQTDIQSSVMLRVATTLEDISDTNKTKVNRGSPKNPED